MLAAMDAEVRAALWNLEAAFVAHTPSALDGPDPRATATAVAAHDDLDDLDEVDAGAWVLALGVTLGGPDDVRALTPWLLAEVVRGDRVDLHTALSRVAQFWSDWTPAEVGAVRNVVDALWCAVLDRHPGRPPAPGLATTETTAVRFLDAASGLGEPPDRLLDIWDYRQIPSADHHLAELVVDAFYGARVHPAVIAWSIDGPQRERLRRALRRDRDEPWAGDLAAAVDLLPV